MSSKTTNITIVGIPTEAGTHFAGQRLAAKALIERAKLPLKLEKHGYKVSVVESIFESNPSLQATAAWKPTPQANGVRNEENTVAVLKHIKSTLSSKEVVDITKTFPFFIGGDCSITPGILSGMHQVYPPGTKIGVIYFDGDIDLTIPDDSRVQVDGTGVLDSMVMTHLTLREGYLKSMGEFSDTNGRPLVTPENIVIYGFDPIQPQLEHWVYMLETGFKTFTRPTVQKDPVGTAKKAVEWLEKQVDIIFLHFDVDVIDSSEFPLGNYPHYAGLTSTEALDAAKVFLQSKKLKGLVVTEVNPNNDPDGFMIEKLVDELVEGFAQRK